MWWIYALLSALFASLTAIVAKKGLKDMDSDLATAIRTVVILGLAWAIVLVKGNATVSGMTRQNWLFLVLSGLMTGLSWLFYFKAIQLGQVSKVAPVDKLSVALTIVLSIIFLHEAVTWKTAIGAGLVLVGTVVIIL